MSVVIFGLEDIVGEGLVCRQGAGSIHRVLIESSIK